ncbi:tRNA preQ1(34) S-adenosylmethionine ribosyltransferase-isomerase QueA [Haliangium ochraceum]|uniref:S-adenosylmethionine:tRNA ribosyltransferase-isomerase n=1 Tax=Haliangium ochraceum (strain DSM 14365 / JCM 11303 / SMP-2) TaxID=502025 RepID=D0LJ83_HALO1|nr:tRNA preQ1(34) S-adenosylmethionine ribosyltransferase-isomerase QueA [Haliangium ochraceum]ACY14930.1 S-adenosylmethionine/tRNA-ribosyltransferase-iso merase [Haliangium ochraceum DSM 14365]
MRLRSDYHFDLPDGQIAQLPSAQRDDSRLLLLRAGAAAEDRGFRDIIDLLPADAVLVVNDTRVLPARLRARKHSGGAVELLFLERVEVRGVSEQWRCMGRSSKPLREGAQLRVLASDAEGVLAETGDTVSIAGERGEDGTLLVDIAGDGRLLLERAGELPLPPYIARPEGPETLDSERYQTIFARAPGAVAAPTAGLHFTPAILDALQAKGAAIAPLTLHVGPGTFLPVRTEEIAAHHMHLERYEVPETTAALVASGRPVVAVGTTCVRALESAARAAARDQDRDRDDGARRLAVGPGQTDLFITPGYRFRAVDWMVTNFHLPESTLLMLVCAFAGYRRVLDSYRHAVDAGYRFFSYGDAMLVERAPE